MTQDFHDMDFSTTCNAYVSYTHMLPRHMLDGQYASSGACTPIYPEGGSSPSHEGDEPSQKRAHINPSLVNPDMRRSSGRIAGGTGKRETTVGRRQNFEQQLRQLLSAEYQRKFYNEYGPYVCWCSDGIHLIIRGSHNNNFLNEMLPKCGMKTTKRESLTRQLNQYHFRKIQEQKTIDKYLTARESRSTELYIHDVFRKDHQHGLTRKPRKDEVMRRDGVKYEQQHGKIINNLQSQVDQLQNESLLQAQHLAERKQEVETLKTQMGKMQNDFNQTLGQMQARMEALEKKVSLSEAQKCSAVSVGSRPSRTVRVASKTATAVVTKNLPADTNQPILGLISKANQRTTRQTRKSVGTRQLRGKGMKRMHPDSHGSSIPPSHPAGMASKQVITRTETKTTMVVQRKDTM